MSDLGFIALALALSSTTYSVVALALGIRKGESWLVTAGKRAIYASAALVTLAVLALTYALLTRDFQIVYVASHTSRDLPLAYTLSALWAGQEGSLLFWAWLLSIYASVAALLGRRGDTTVQSYSALVVACVLVFFLGLLIVVNNPFARLDFVPSDGLGMNPLLQNPAMIWHPPVVYLGYVGFTVPFAMTVATLLGGRMKDPYVPLVRRWTLFPWLCLGVGTLLGAQWAYVELGWGGYWAWDPVENASLLPWLTATAVVHSLMFRGQRIKVSHIVLMVATFALCIFGTFVTRSGMIDSVHAFAVSTIGFYFLGFLALIFAGSVILTYWRRKSLVAEGETEPLLSRPSTLLFTIVLLLAGTLAILIGTLFPLVSQALNVALTTDYFNISSAAIFGPLILLMGICVFVPWRGISLRGLARELLGPIVAALVVGAIVVALGVRDILMVVAFSICALVLVATVMQFFRGLGRGEDTKRGRLRSALSLLRRQSRRYGGYLVHLGIVLITIGVIGSTAYKQEQQLTIERGSSKTVGQYTLRYDDFSFVPVAGIDVTTATLTVLQEGREVAVLRPERHFHQSSQQPVSEVDIRSTLVEDLYVALIGWDEGGRSVILQVVVSPLVNWIWIGGIVLLIGGVWALVPSRRPEGVDRHIEEAIGRLRKQASPLVQEGGGS
ncbi:MAG TPA: heme lyase CcmF/NrfE family subunit [Chloroflexi bacterium]|nr:heme lyase CcmF/NrfE family subunit [Chloroflexota bacterium]